MAPMGDDTPGQCRWAALAGAEAAIAPSKLVDLPPKEQVARGRELLSMLGCGREDSAKSPAAQKSRESDRMDSGASMASSMSRHLDSLASQSQDAHVSSFAPAATTVGVQQVVSYDGSEWMVQGGFGSRPDDTTAAPNAPLWGSSAASGSVHTASAGTPWSATNAILTNWSMGMPSTAVAAATVTPIAVMGATGPAVWQPLDSGSTGSLAGWTAGAAMTIPSDMQCMTAAPGMGIDLAVPVPMPMVMASSSELGSSMLSRNQMRAEAAPCTFLVPCHSASERKDRFPSPARAACHANFFVREQGRTPKEGSGTKRWMLSACRNSARLLACKLPAKTLPSSSEPVSYGVISERSPAIINLPPTLLPLSLEGSRTPGYRNPSLNDHPKPTPGTQLEVARQSEQYLERRGCDPRPGMRVHRKVVVQAGTLPSCCTVQPANEDSRGVLNQRLLAACRDNDIGALKMALEEGAFLETRRPFVMRPKPPSGVFGDEGHQIKRKTPKEGLTPLMYASQNGSVSAVHMLMEARANIMAKDEETFVG
ncbi:unnamed protein product [Symbiodinium natans]|uniref:Uncharacterized protein n=1 Tax=Symbiodinium natans TaxID=878477 RepID=A0A812I6E6_9DINO|nr:unnamed protein product [Symbiodinium natans]